MASSAKDTEEPLKIAKRPKDQSDDEKEEKTEDSVSLTIRYFASPGRATPLRRAAYLNGLSYKDEFLTSFVHSTAISLQSAFARSKCVHCIPVLQICNTQWPNMARIKQQERDDGPVFLKLLYTIKMGMTCSLSDSPMTVSR